MSERFQTMKCYILTADSSLPECPEERKVHVKDLEKGYQQYARLFEQVHLVIDEDQARDQYLNYPYITNKSNSKSKAVSVASALEDSDGETVFIGSSEFHNFPLELAIDLVKQYNGESFLGYYDSSAKKSGQQPLFGIYNQKLAGQLNDLTDNNGQALEMLLSEHGKLLPLPMGTEGNSIGIR